MRHCRLDDSRCMLVGSLLICSMPLCSCFPDGVVTFMSRLTCSSTCAALDHRSLMLAPSIRFNLVAVGREFVAVRQRVTDGVAIVSRGCFVSGQCWPMPAQFGTIHDLAFTSKCLASRDDHLDPTMRSYSIMGRMCTSCL